MHERIFGPAQVAGELQPRALHRHYDLRGAQNVPCRQEGGLDPSPKVKRNIKVVRPETVQRPHRVGR